MTVKNLIRSLSILAVLLALVIAPASAQQGPRQRAFAAGNFFLELGGVKTGFLRDTNGGEPKADVITFQAGSDHLQRKALGRLSYTPITLQFGFSMAPPVYEWINDTWAAKFTRKDGSIHAIDFNLQAKSQRQFHRALISEVTIPACDGSVKDPAYLKVKIVPEETQDLPAQGSVAEFNRQDLRARQWRPSQFRLLIDGVDCTRVSKIDSFTVKQKILEYLPGEERTPGLEPTGIEFPNLKITLLASHGETWLEWFRQFVVLGNSGDDKEKEGTLEFLSPDLKTTLATIKFHHLGIFSLAPAQEEDKVCDCDFCEKQIAAENNTVIPKMSAGLYCARMEFMFASQD